MKKSPKDIVWNIFFAIMYPVITVFSLIFTGILTIFSAISRSIVYVLQLFKK